MLHPLASGRRVISLAAAQLSSWLEQGTAEIFTRPALLPWGYSNMKRLFQRMEDEAPICVSFLNKSIFSSTTGIHLVLFWVVTWKDIPVIQQACTRRVVSQTCDEKMAIGKVLGKVEWKDTRDSTKLPQFKSPFTYLIVMWPWVCYSTSLCLSFLICKWEC